MNENTKQQEQKGNGVLPCVSERYLLIEWIQGHPLIDGAKYADTKQELMDYYNSLPKLPKSLVEYTICRIYNVR
jgi:hypothetical protein